MNDAQRAAFAQTGYLVIHDALSPEQLAELNAVYDANVGRLTGGPGRERGIYDTAMTTDRHGNTYEGQRMWSQAYRDLIDNPTVLPILQEILGDPHWQHAVPSLPPHLRPRIRLDHANIHHRQPGQPKLGRLHGGPSSWHATAVYELKSVGPGDGGLGACAGSHTPAGRERLETMGIETWRDEWTDSAWTSKHPGWPVDVPVHRLEGQAGDCIVFTEKMTHGTVPWEGADERRTLFYKYVPYGMHHADACFDVNDPALSPRQNYKEGLYASNVGMTRRHPLAAALDTQRQHGQRVVAAAAAAANAKM